MLEELGGNPNEESDSISEATGMRKINLHDVMKSDDDKSTPKKTKEIPGDYDSDAGDELPEPSDSASE